MLTRFFYLVVLVGSLVVSTRLSALPPPSTLHDKLLRDESRKRAKATPTPAPAVPASISDSSSDDPTAARATTVAATRSTRPARSESSSVSSSSRSGSTQAGRSSTVVVIDAGHGGHDRGGIAGQRVAEKTMNLDVAQRLRSILNSNGYRTVMTRDSDVFVPLGTRVAIANAYSNGIFVCIHFNSATRRAANGIETYFYSSQSLGLASAIHYYVSRGAPSSNRGVRRRGYFVLRRTTVPSVLVECGFLTNPSEAQYAQSANYRQMLAEQIARGIRSRTMGGGGGGRYASNDTVPNQPYIDQTHVRDPDISGHKGRAKSTKSSKSKKTTSSSTSKKKRSSDDDDSDSKPKKKKSTTKKKSED